MLGEVVHQQPRDLELVDERAVLVGGPSAVGIAVQQQPEVQTVGDQPCQPLVDVGVDRLGVHAAEVRVALLVDLGNADPAAGQQPRDPAGAGAPERVHQHRHVGRAQRIEVQGAPHEPLVAVVRVEALDQPGRLGIRERPPLHLVGAVLGQPRLDDRQHLGPAAAPVGALTLNPLSTHGL